MADLRRAQRSFWVLTVTAVLALGALFRALGAPAGPATGLLTLISGIVVVAASVQAARILARLTGPSGRRSGRTEPAIRVFGRRR